MPSTSCHRQAAIDKLPSTSCHRQAQATQATQAAMLTEALEVNQKISLGTTTNHRKRISIFKKTIESSHHAFPTREFV